MKLTIEKIKAYLEDSENCPFCGSPYLAPIFSEEGNEMEYISDNEWKRETYCADCKKSFREYYRLHDIEELDESGSAIPNEEAKP